MKTYLQTGKIDDRRLTRPTEGGLLLHAAKPLPVKRRRIQTLSTRVKKRERYYANAVVRIEHGEAGLAKLTWVRNKMGGGKQAHSRNE